MNEDLSKIEQALDDLYKRFASLSKQVRLTDLNKFPFSTFVIDNLKRTLRWGEANFSYNIVAGAIDVATGDGQYYFHIPEFTNGKRLFSLTAQVITAGTTNATSIQIHNLTRGLDMLSTNITIDSGETTSLTAATPYVINNTNSQVFYNDLIRIDVDAVSTTAPKGLIISLNFR